MQHFSHSVRNAVTQIVTRKGETIDCWCEPQGRCFYSCLHKLFFQHWDDFVMAVSMKESRELKPPAAVLLCNFVLCLKSDFIPTWG